MSTRPDQSPGILSHPPPAGGRTAIREYSPVLVFAAVCAMSTPLLGSAGFGRDPDAWSVAEAARRINATGEYHVSRLPGYPVQEWICSIVWAAAPGSVCALATLFSAASASMLLLCLTHWRIRDAWLAALTLALTPIVYIHSTTAMDYDWALAFMLAAQYAVLRRHPAAGGVLLGLAVGCRITSGAMLFPLAILLAMGEPRSTARVRDAFVMSAATVAVAAAAYWPLYSRYGLAFLHFYDPHRYPSAATVLYKATIQVWGVVGCVGLLAGVCWAVVSRPARDARRSVLPPGVLPAGIVAIVLYVLAYLRLPMEGGYLIPAVPYVIILLARILPQPAFRFTCALICLSPFVMSLDRADELSGAGAPAVRGAIRLRLAGQSLVLDPFRGPILRDRAERVAAGEFVERLLAGTRDLPPRSAVLVGSWIPQLRVTLNARLDKPENEGQTWDPIVLCGPAPQAEHAAQPPAVVPVHLAAPPGNGYAAAADADRVVEFLYVARGERLEEFKQRNVAIFYLAGLCEFNRSTVGVDPRDFGATELDVR